MRGFCPTIDVHGLLALGCRSRSNVGIGLDRAGLAILEGSLERGGCALSVSGFDDSAELVRALQKGKIDAAVRGTLSSSAVLTELRRTFGVAEIMRVALLEDSTGKPFLLAPVGIDEGRDLESRTRIAEAATSFFLPMKWRLRIGVLSKGRAEDAARGPDIKLSIQEGEDMVASLRAKGFEARHFAILVEEAVKECDLIMAPDGITGNLMFRSLHFLGGRRAFGAPVVNLNKIFVDTSRSKSDFSDAIRLAAGLVQARTGLST